MIESSANSLAELSRLEQRLAQIESPRDAKNEVMWADVMADLARGLGLSLEEQNRIAEHRLRAMRRGGQLIPQSGIGKGIKSRTLRDFDLTDDESRRWQLIANLDDGLFEDYIARTVDAREELTTAGLLKLRLRPVPESESRPMADLPLLRFSQVDLPSATIISLILRVMFSDAETALDVTYGSGMFWDGSAHVRVTAHDSQAGRSPDGVVDFRSLAYSDETFDVVLFDPPHLADSSSGSIMAERFGTYPDAEMEPVISRGTQEAWRVARLGIIVKITDHIHGQQFVSEADWVRAALDRRKPYDVVHQVRSGALVDPKWHEQLSAYNNGSTYLIFRKDSQKHIRR